MHLRALLLACALLVSAEAPAQTPAGDPEAVLAEELVVRAKVPGPAWWQAKDADSTVWILGAPAALPNSVAWTRQPLALRLEGAKALLTPVTGKISTLGALAFFLRNGDAFRSQRPLEETLSPEMRTRFVAARERVGKPASRYARWKPGMAALLLSSDFYDGLDLQTDEPMDTVRAAARRARVPVKKSAEYDMNPVLREFARMSDADQLICLDDALRLVEAGQARVRDAARGWADGDLGRALDLERGFERCIGAMPTAAEATRRALGDTTTTIVEALKRPGTSVMVAGLRSLVARDGVILRLRAQGIEVRTPEE